ncbi:hypothetical protein BDV98DRAFT_649078 [Pterulicium gracile]|uniref:Sterol 3-beta-glucosyltransferase n=1 Tax=Pterulicium gracile TaxID=1884261 RepID=A0A5C3QNN1_9AGAR|nr:hypothetical protein BDV98DRAFT_649078 [Pterula gracilis]
MHHHVPDPQPAFKFHGVPVAAHDVDTSPESLGMSTDQQPTSTEQQSPGSSRLKRAVDKTVDKVGETLGRSKSGKSSSTNGSPGQSRSRLFSLSRRRKYADDSASSDVDSNEISATPSRPSMTSRKSSSDNAASPRPSGEESPFIRPPSPSTSNTRPSLSAFRGDGSVRAGTQSLIQALQALPWSEGSDDSSSDDAGTDEGAEPLASSLHTIHRPVARSRRTALAHPGFEQHPIHESIVEASEESESDMNEDFDQHTPRISHASPPMHAKAPPALARTGTVMNPRNSMTRTGSMATVRLQRRARLAEKLRDIFELDGIEEVWAEMPCWLLRSILLQGYLYITNSHLCYFAHLPSREDQVLKSGSLNKKAQRTKRWIKHWFILKNDALSWYQSSSDPYFPHGIVDLRYAISCDPLNEKDFRIRTNQKAVHLSADSIPSRDEWVKAIRKVMFKAQNMGDSVKIAIPYSAIIDIEKSSAMDFSETIEVKVLDKEEQGATDSYFFAYFHEIDSALEQLRHAVRAHRAQPALGSPGAVMDTTIGRLTAVPLDRVHSAPISDPHSLTAHSSSASSSSFKLPSFLRPFHDSSSTVAASPLARAESSPEVGPQHEEFTHISRSTNSFVPHEEPSSLGLKTDVEGSALGGDVATPRPGALDHSHTYPPSSSTTSDAGDNALRLVPSSSSTLSNWSVGVPSWLKSGGTRRPLSGGSNSNFDPSDLTASQKVREMYTSADESASSRSVGDMAFSVLDSPNTVLDDEVVEKFHSTFAFDEKEVLLGYVPGYIFRLLPVYGRLYVSSNFFCFKSTNPLVKTRMQLPIRDILAMEKSKGNRLGHHGLIVVIKGHEELFFEFGAVDKREVFYRLLDRQMEDIRKRVANGETESVSSGKREALVLEELEAPPTAAEPNPATDAMSESLPALMFTSASSTFLTFKPATPLRFTFLTIGSRGDVQPYISLAKGLMAEGHHCKIATHGEFQEWIESYGIQFGFVGGDPAELMRICVENGTFTLSFMKEGVQKFRGWIDDLLKTSWTACQDTDVLIESPSAMAGYHVAEALGIPYFRAFTMTWSRTRAYPHSFAVPEHKMGGGYNYMTYVMFDQVFWRATAAQINRWRRRTLHLESTSLDKMEPHKIPFLYNFSPSVVPPPLDWPEWIRVSGYWFLDDADVSSEKWTPPDELVQFIEAAHQMHKKIVYIGFGSIVVSDPRTMTRCVIEAVVRSGVCAILSKGWSDRLQADTRDVPETEAEEPLPKQIYQINSAPHDWLFQRIDAACHHGGAGTTGASLRAGIPTIIKPFFGDQFFWADRVEALGVGSGVRKFTVDTLTDALSAATTDVKQIDRARLLGEAIRSENGVATAIEAIYRDLEYARSLIKGGPRQDDDGTIKEKRNSAHSSVTSLHNGSEDWSVISDQDDSGSSPERSKRSSIAHVVKSVLP